MATRTCRIMGVSYGDPASPASITVDFAGERVFSGTIPTRSGPEETIDSAWDQHDVLCSWDTTVNLGETVPVTVTVTNGTVTVSRLTMNNRGDKVTASLKPGSNWPAYTPDTLENYLADIKDLALSDFETKYGFSNYNAQDYIDQVVEKVAAEHFQPFPKQTYTDIMFNNIDFIVPLKLFPNAKNIHHFMLASGDILAYNLTLRNATAADVAASTGLRWQDE